MISYRAGYKYQLVADYTLLTACRPSRFVLTPFIRMDADGMLSIIAGFAWDGPSGPTIDTPNFMRGSLVHDALYQLLREGYLPQGQRKTADEELRRICLEDGMSSLRACWVYNGVRFGGGPHAAVGEKPALVAP